MQRLSEEVRQVVYSVDVGYPELHVLDTFADKEVPAIDVLGARMKFWIIGDSDGGLVVHAHLQRLGGTVSEFVEELREVERKIASLAASEAAMISASQEDSATLVCFLEPQETTAVEYVNCQPDVECLTPQSESLCPRRGFFSAS